jgi:hypothetical protein
LSGSQQSQECKDYADALYKNPLRKINPAYVFVELVSLVAFHPMEKFGVNYAKFQRAIWGKRSCGFEMCGFVFFFFFFFFF